MTLYNIHTHHLPMMEYVVTESPIVTIVNSSPLHYDADKEQNDSVWFSCGVHPWEIDDADKQLAALQRMLADNRVVALGEAGLDKLKGGNFATQQRVFEQHIQWSEEVEKPLIIHCVKAWDELLALKKKYTPHQPWVVHGYRGKEAQAKQLLREGFYFSVNDRFNADTVRTIALERLFCETDVSPVGIAEVYKRVAEARQIPVETLSQQIDENTRRVFPLFFASENTLS